MPEMRLSTDHILVSHTGNLPRPDTLNRLIDIGEGPNPAPRLIDRYAFHQRLPRAVEGIVDRQIELGVDVVNDGEYVKAGSYGGYIHERRDGLRSSPFDPLKAPKRAPPSGRDALAFPRILRFRALVRRGRAVQFDPASSTPGQSAAEPKTVRVCTGPVEYVGQAAIAEDMPQLQGGARRQAGRRLHVLRSGPLSLGGWRSATSTTRRKRRT